MMLVVELRRLVDVLVTVCVTPDSSWLGLMGASSEIPRTSESWAISASAAGVSSALIPRRWFFRKRPPRLDICFLTLSPLSERWRMITRVLPESFEGLLSARSSLARCFPEFPEPCPGGESLPSATEGNTVASDSMRHASRRTFMATDNRKQGAVGFSSHLAGLASEGCSRVLARRQNTAAGRGDRECDRRFFRLFLPGACAGPRSAVNVGFSTARAGITSALRTAETRSCRINGAGCTLRHSEDSIAGDSSTGRAGAIAPDWRPPRSREVTERRHVVAPSRK